MVCACEASTLRLECASVRGSDRISMIRSLPASFSFWSRFFSSSSSGREVELLLERSELSLEVDVLLVVAPQLRLPLEQGLDQLLVFFLHTTPSACVGGLVR